MTHESEKPVYYKRDLLFMKLVVDRLKVDMLGNDLEYTVYYAGTSEYIFVIYIVIIKNFIGFGLICI